MCTQYFQNYIRAANSVLWIQTHEEFRAMTLFANEVKASKRQLFCWDRVSGLKGIQWDNGGLKFAEVQVPDELKADPDPLLYLDWINKNIKKDAVIFLLDMHNYVSGKGGDVVIRKIRNLLMDMEGPSFKATGRTLVIISHTMDIPPELEKEVTPIKFKLPDIDELKIVLQAVCDSTNAAYPENEEPILKAATGLTIVEAENAFALSLVEGKGIEFSVKVIQREKANAIRKSGCLTIIDQVKNITDIGGLDNLKTWLNNRIDCFSNDAREDGIQIPKGIILAGISGTGKSLSAKAIASILKRPLLRFDAGQVYGKYVGDSEANMHTALITAEAIAPCILWADEIEKGFGGSDNESNGGTSNRILQEMLIWLQEKTKDVFVVATANSVHNLPPEFLRPGRFDALFWVDLPEQKQREEIFSIHLQKVKRDPVKFNIQALAKASKGYTGAEIEYIVQEALILARSRKQTMSDEHLLACIPEVTPISKLRVQDITKSRKWAEDHGVKYANPKIKEELTGASKRKIDVPLSPGIGS